ncbi:GH92 family glycosyl hydrolase [Mucilaginibacter ginsenosidivorans]|uniref:Glycoside hydrolase family 92 protein n=1 Tax=Mucilaginibacter ginsenosidivorans TaxID=398053 RepID=A0A5B8UWW1_9SPHI|nr:GH92 family glycosyl hydrolase [Mucilaginibacter ginsenosidivorans]QEC63534.1 glycoside hydrolase family 92 protein [Mucilaginibacter ginsenosidivorans]
MKKPLLLLLTLIPFFSFSQTKKSADLAEYVNPLMGTDSKYDLSNGNTYPVIALPWGMNFWTPETGKMGDGWQYTYDAHKINGFKQTHQPSPWMNDYGQFAIMPETGHLKVTQNGRQSWFSHKTEIVKPYYYSVYLADHDVTTEITPTERSAQFRFTFPKNDSSFIVIDAFDRGSYVKVIPSERKIVGYSTKFARGPLKNFKNFFVIYVDKPISIYHTYSDSTMTDSLELHAKHASAVIGFKTAKGEKVHMRVASSFVSIEQAELNLQREQGKDSFDVTEQKAKDVWNKTLSRLTVEGGTIDQKRTFYSCLYRMLFFPNKLYEIDANGNRIHYSPYTGKTEPGYMFAGTGFWDTFRALYPFLNLVYPSINKEMQEGLINDYKEGGWLPEWSSPGYSDVMVGNNSASVVAEAYLKGLRGYDIETLYKALIHGANNDGPRATGRKGVEYYNKLGYVPYDVKINENAARTLEYAYDDFAIYQLGKALGKPKDEIEVYKKRSMNYKNLFDPATGLMRGKNQDGTFETPFNPFKWGDAFTEGNSWHYTWGVFHDIQGLENLMGGKKKFVAKLDSVFSLPPIFDDSYYGEVIHEIREMQIAGMGQYAHGNQPIQHMIYLYNYAGEPWKTQYWARETMNKLYKATPDGYCGDEDNGQTSAWYVFSAMGFYPVCPAAGQYVLGAPLFNKVTLTLENGRKVIINAPKNSAANKYVNTLTYNGKPYDLNYLDHKTLMQGAVLNFEMSAAPNKQRGIKDSDFPYSLSNEK